MIAADLEVISLHRLRLMLVVLHQMVRQMDLVGPPAGPLYPASVLYPVLSMERLPSPAYKPLRLRLVKEARA